MALEEDGGERRGEMGESGKWGGQRLRKESNRAEHQEKKKEKKSVENKSDTKSTARITPQRALQYEFFSLPPTPPPIKDHSSIFVSIAR